MLITIKTANGHNINDGGNYSALLQNPHGMPDAAPVFIDQANSDSVDAGVFTVDVQNKVLNIKVLNYTNRYALISQLKTWFKRGNQIVLVAIFADDGVDYQLTCRVVNVVQDSTYLQNFTVTLQTGTSAWRAVTETTESTWTVTGTSDTHDIDVGGKDETFLSLDLTASAGPASGYLYQDIYRLPNPDGVVLGLIPWCITVDTATLIGAGKMQDDCDDLRIIDLRNGREFRRWISGANTDSTKVWVNLPFRKGFSLPLATTIAGAGSISEMQFSITDDVKAKIAEMPTSGIIYHGNEWFAYSNTDPANCKLIISQRGLFGTTIESHTAGVSFLYIQFPLAMKYGNATVASPASTDVTYDYYRPVIDLANSTNTSWVWSGTSGFVAGKGLPMTAGWKTARKALGPNSGIYYAKQETGPDLALGMRVQGYVIGGTYYYDTVELSASVFHAAGITSVTMTGQKYRGDVAWLSTAAVRASLDGVDYGNLFAEASPSGSGSFEAWSNNGMPTSTPAGTQYVQVIFAGSYGGLNSIRAYLELLTATAAINSSNIPTGAFLGELNAYPLVVTIKNDTTGDTIQLNYVMALDTQFSINGETRIVQYNNYNAFGSLTLDDESRSEYIRLQGGVTNTISIAGSDLGTLDIVLRWYARRL